MESNAATERVGRRNPGLSIASLASRLNPRGSFAARLALLTSVLVALTAAVLSAFLYFYSTQHMLPLEIGRLSHSLSLASRQFESKVEGAARTVRSLTTVPPLKALTVADNDGTLYEGANAAVWKRRLATIFTGAMQANPEYFQLRYIGRDGREIVRVERTTDGRIVTVPTGRLQQKGSRPYFRAAIGLRRGGLYLSRFELNREFGRIETPHRATFRVAGPVVVTGNRPIGIIIANIDLTSWLRDIAAAAPDGSRFFVTNQSGDYLLHPDKGQTFGFDLGRRYRLNADYPQMSPLFGKTDRKVLHAVTGNDVVYGLRSAIPQAGDARYIVFAAASLRSDALAYTLATRDWSIAITAIMIGIAILLAVLLARLLIRPLVRVKEAAVRVADGDLETQVPEPDSGGREISELAHSFNLMVDNLKSTLVDRSHLEEEVKQRRAAEEEIRGTSLELEKANASLASEREALIGANASLEQFAYIASHDLRAPMRGISSLAQFVLEDAGDALPKESRDDLAQIQERTEAMNRMLDGLLEYARSTRGDGAPDRVDVNALVAEIAGTFELPGAFSIDVAADLPAITTHAAPLGQVFRNLIDNAIKYHDRDDGTITVTGRRTGNIVEYTVADDGPGIDPADHERIFKLFQSAAGPAANKGSGLGLAVVRRTINAHGGTLDLDSAPGEGARFIFTWRDEGETQ